ncbi:MAG: transposase family protein [Patescibacteria group bacterium]
MIQKGQLTSPNMLRYHTLKKKPAHFKSFTGFTVEEFENLADEIHLDWAELQKSFYKPEKKRLRKYGGGRKLKLATLEDQLLLALVWVKLYCTNCLLEYLFGIDETKIKGYRKRIQPLFQNLFLLPKDKRKKIRTLEELRKIIPDLDAVISDATEQQISRPGKKRKQRKYYSGKKKKHTVKTQITSTVSTYILDVSESVEGKRSDYKLLQESGVLKWIRNLKLYVDLGYQGIDSDFPEINAVIPRKKPRGKPQTRSNKIFNRKMSRIRVRVENAIAKLKKFRVLGEKFRHNLKDYNATFRMIASLVNFRTLQRNFE